MVIMQLLVNLLSNLIKLDKYQVYADTDSLKLLNGYDVLDKVASVQTDENDKPLKDQVLKSIKFVSKFEGDY